MNVAEMTGLEVMQAIVAGKLPKPPMAETMAINFEHVESGYVRFTAVAGERHLNPMGGVHGGFAATIMDSVTGCVVHTMLEPGIPYGTIDLQVKMLRPVPVGETVNAEGKIINMSRRLGVSEGSLKDKNGKVLAHATCTCMVIRK